MSNLEFAYSATGCSATFKIQPEDFIVNEHLNFTPSGEGDHLYLYIEKKNANTDWLSRELADKANLMPLDVGYAGRKDRHAVTRQWFSLHLPQSRKVDINLFQGDDYRLVDHSRHNKKLRKGEIAFNQFKIQLTDFEGSYRNLSERIKQISESGYPNYFGAQRFGKEGGNIVQAQAMLSGAIRIKDKNKRSIYLSAARSFLFNQILSRRIDKDCWQTPIKGDQYFERITGNLTPVLEIDETLMEKINNAEYILTAALPGDGRNSVTDLCLALESDVLVQHEELFKGIRNSRVNWHRRPLKVIPQNLTAQENSQGVLIEFDLKTGAYATSLLRELILSKNNDLV